MSRENVELVTELFATAGSMDKQTLLAAMPDLIERYADPEIEWQGGPSRTDGRTYRGHDGVLTSWTQWLEQWNAYGLELERAIDAGEAVLAVVRERATGLASGTAVSSLTYQLITLRQRKIVRWREYADAADALAAAGLDDLGLAE